MNDNVIKIGNIDIRGIRYNDVEVGVMEELGTEKWQVYSTVPVTEGTFKPEYDTWMQAVIAAENFAGRLQGYKQIA